MSTIDDQLKIALEDIKARVERRSSKTPDDKTQWKKFDGSNFLSIIDDTIAMMKYQQLELIKKAEEAKNMLILQEKEKQNRAYNLKD